MDSNIIDSKKNEITKTVTQHLGTVNPDSLAQIGRFARSGRISPYRIKLHAISEKLNSVIIGSDEISPLHLESLVRVSDLLLMKAEFVANGGQFPIKEKKSVFDENEDKKLEDNFQTLKMLTNLIERNLHEISASYPRPNPPTLVKDELKMPNSKRLLKIIEKMMGTEEEKSENLLVVKQKTLDIKSAMREILERLKEGIQVLFDMLIKPGATRFDIIASLLALLELVKRQQVDIYQNDVFGPILIEKR